MDWKAYYREELSSPRGRELAMRLAERTEVDPKISGPLAEGDVVSFPHTSLFYAGDLVMRVVASLYGLRPRSVLALGVFHVWGIEPWAEWYRGLMEGELPGEEALSRLGGAFLPPRPHWDTPFGGYPLALPPPRGVVRALPGLEAEYSLDLFLSLALLYARSRGLAPLQVTPLFVGVTGGPGRGCFPLAGEVADFVSRLGAGAVVATGDLVHFGTVYSPEGLLRKLPQQGPSLREALLSQVGDMLGYYLVRHDWEEGFHQAQLLNCDQRYMLPVIADLLGPGAGYEVLEFRLSDYAPIWDVEGPCFVSSALVVYRRGRRWRSWP